MLLFIENYDKHKDEKIQVSLQLRFL